MKANKGFSLLEVTIAILTMGLTVAALLNVLQWSNLNYKSVSTNWKERALFTEVRLWLRKQILIQNNQSPTLTQLEKEVKCPDGYFYKELTVTRDNSKAYFIKLGIYEDRNNNQKADSDEVTNRLFCFMRRTV